MQSRSKNDVLLTELIIVVLFFSLVAVTVVQMFVTARNESNKSYQIEQALIAAQSWAGRLSGAPDPAAVLLEGGFSQEGETAFALENPKDKLLIRAELQPVAQSQSGKLLSATMSVFDTKSMNGKPSTPMVTLPVSSYIPQEEVQP